ncbi:hypothetical protein BKA56DRAFT_574975 [Ilyonectria sp. MPI-CAGE-AT-0026]|nr:hypothetical protein BKA56DRAFT_574975 [Ilyonectria sp. MPI-CAGE-AT-0026]
MALPLSATLSSLPPVITDEPQAKVRAILQDPAARAPVLVILDDDPTGTQTCNNIPVLLIWDTETLSTELQQTPTGEGFFILTNSRALHPEPAEALIAEICTNLQAASAATGIAFEIVLRSDSTLRGHFPLEVDVAERILGAADACLLCPFFFQGGRYTIDDVHYVVEGDILTPAADTPFAKDGTFGYANSNLRAYVEEKSMGRIPADTVASLSLDVIRNRDPDVLFEQLLQVPKGSVVVVNATTDQDVDAVVLAVLRAASQGKRYIYRTGAAFVSARLAIAQIAPISSSQLSLSPQVGGLIIAGSYVPKTTAQLNKLIASSGDRLTVVELQVEQLLRSPEDASKAVADAIAIAEREITRGQDTLVMTSRKLIKDADKAKSLTIGSIVANALVQFLVELKTKPRYIIAKGGITSSDMATKGLRMQRALILGQAASGVPLWRCDEVSSKWPSLPYVVFPGNVGTDEALFQLVDSWSE